MEKFFTSTERTTEITLPKSSPSFSDAFSQGNTFTCMSHNTFRSPQETIAITDPDIYKIEINL